LPENNWRLTIDEVAEIYKKKAEFRSAMAKKAAILKVKSDKLKKEREAIKVERKLLFK
jgi:hypothetical protein